MHRSTYNFVQCCICVIYIALCISTSLIVSLLCCVCVFLFFASDLRIWFSLLLDLVFFASKPLYAIRSVVVVVFLSFSLFVGQRQKCTLRTAFRIHIQLNEWIAMVQTLNGHRAQAAVAKEWVINKSYMFRYSFFFPSSSDVVTRVRINPLEANADAAAFFSFAIHVQRMILAFSFVYWISNGISLPWHHHWMRKKETHPTM